MRTWDEVVEKFLKKYFPESKTDEGKASISSFHQFPDESLSEALERFCSLLWKTPTNGFSEPIQLNIFTCCDYDEFGAEIDRGVPRFESSN